MSFKKLDSMKAKELSMKQVKQAHREAKREKVQTKQKQPAKGR